VRKSIYCARNRCSSETIGNRFHIACWKQLLARLLDKDNIGQTFASKESCVGQNIILVDAVRIASIPGIQR
jgi:hypothetical protein